jgi:hypothetical protein
MNSIELSVETKRFLNHIERKIDIATAELENKNFFLEKSLSTAKCENEKLLHKINSTNATFNEIAAALGEMECRYRKLISAVSRLIPKIRVDIWTGKTSTPRYFESGKWWSRETGNLDAEFVSEMTNEEKIEAVDFYSTTELPFMAKPSMRDEVAGFDAAKNLWYQYESYPDRATVSFPQFCGLMRKEFKEGLKKQIEYSEKISKIAE